MDESCQSMSSLRECPCARRAVMMLAGLEVVVEWQVGLELSSIVIMEMYFYRMRLNDERIFPIVDYVSAAQLLVNEARRTGLSSGRLTSASPVTSSRPSTRGLLYEEL